MVNDLKRNRRGNYFTHMMSEGKIRRSEELTSSTALLRLVASSCLVLKFRTLLNYFKMNEDDDTASNQ